MKPIAFVVMISQNDGKKVWSGGFVDCDVVEGGRGQSHLDRSPLEGKGAKFTRSVDDGRSLPCS
eukprot:m.146187 g.146187  ORF g.146187 m.146187 type:complete len:64 (+) comp38447_c0_seq5:206-397(+)